MLRTLVLLTAFLSYPIALPAAAGPPATSRPTATARLSDAEIEQTIHTRLAKSKIGKDGFVAKVHGGVVTWEGRTSVPQHKGAATRMAKAAGAVRVVNNIQITDGAKPGQPLRRAQVKPGDDADN
ncbi:MAG TPA: BON domain-containing protein [Bryobacteraceae bacterium]|nr:BON domain-containing protein [Bryobacteraceae bacterium]